MGECNYYLKARFATAAGAKAARSRLAALMAEGEQAYGYWQAERTRGMPRNLPTAKAFWAAFRERFPRVREYLAKLDGIKDWNNGLAGQLGMLIAPRRRRREPSASLVCEGDLLYLRMNGIWHGSDLRLLERYCKVVLSAVAVGSASAYPDDEDDEVDEDPDEPFDFIDV